jgi:hypothetical protein
MRYSRADFLHKSDLYGLMTWGLAKKITFRKLLPLFEGFRYEYLIKRMVSIRLITKKNSR